jgi:hypothetical protein
MNLPASATGGGAVFAGVFRRACYCVTQQQFIMRKQTLVRFIAAIALACSVHAQPGHMSGPNFNGSTAKLFGQNTAFSATVEVQITTPQGQTMSMPGKLAFDSGKSRYEISIGDAKGTQMQPGMAEHLKAMNMDTTITITRPDKQTSSVVYPGLSAYIESPLQDPDAAKADSSFKMDSTELGKETIDGHPCVKNKVVVTNDAGKTHESTVWNATDLKNFPVKIEMVEQAHTMTMLFKDIKTSKPDAALFDPPADDKKYDNLSALMQAEMMKRMGTVTMPPGHP